MKKVTFISLGIICVIMACQPDPAILSERQPSPESSGQARVAASFVTRQKLGTVQDRNLDEISGLVASRANANNIWVHEDSGNPNKIYLIDERGVTKATITLPDANRDWEDIAVGPGPQSNTTYIYLADFGDNGASNSKFYIYRFVEPSIAGRALPYSKTLSDGEVQKLDFRYADGSRNAETLLIDPVTKDLIVIAKEDTGSQERPQASAKGGIYRAAYPQPTSGTTVLTRSGSVNIPTATGGDISVSGSEILIKNYDNVYYWQKSKGQSITQTLVTSPTRLSSYNTASNANDREPGGEAIGWKTNGSGFYTISEIKNNIPAAIYFYPR